MESKRSKSNNAEQEEGENQLNTMWLLRQHVKPVLARAAHVAVFTQQQQGLEAIADLCALQKAEPDRKRSALVIPGAIAEMMSFRRGQDLMIYAAARGMGTWMHEAIMDIREPHSAADREQQQQKKEEGGDPFYVTEEGECSMESMEWRRDMADGLWAVARKREDEGAPLGLLAHRQWHCAIPTAADMYGHLMAATPNFTELGAGTRIWGRTAKEIAREAARDSGQSVYGGLCKLYTEVHAKRQ